MGRCNTCALLREPADHAHRGHYRVCGWMPGEAMPANCMSWEVHNIQSFGVPGFEHNRWIARKQIELADKQDRGESLGDNHCFLKVCGAWRPK